MRKPTSLAAMAMMAAALTPPSMGIIDGWDHYTGRDPVRNPKPKNLDNSPDRAKGMKAFEVNGMTIYAGTLKAARKKARLLQLTAP